MNIGAFFREKLGMQRNITAANVATGNAKSTYMPVPWWAIGLFLLAVGYVVVGWADTKQVALAEIMVAFGATSVGALLGFLFGMPRSGAIISAKDNNKKEDDSVDGKVLKQKAYQPNTNLEQISDWLTKILIGAGLVELGRLEAVLSGLGNAINKLTPSVKGGNIFPQIVIVVFLIFGFLLSYIWTRLDYTNRQVSADQTLANQVNGLESVVSSMVKGDLVQPDKTPADNPEAKANHENLVTAETPESNLAAGSVANSSKGVSQPSNINNGEKNKSSYISTFSEYALLESDLSSEIRAKIKEFMSAPAKWNSDPGGYIFGRTPRSEDGYTLLVDIQAILNDVITFKATVHSRNLYEEVFFLLHPTFGREKVTKSNLGSSGTAELLFPAGGWFTLVVIVNKGQTVLSYRLKDVPGVPTWFKNT